MTSRKISILVVEDDTILCQTIRDFLESHDYQVLTAGSGQETEKRLAEAPVDLIILDMMLPDGNGINLAKKIKQRNPSQLIFMLSAYSDEEKRVAGLETGADVFLTKPLTMRELLAQVRALLRRLPPYHQLTDSVVRYFGPFSAFLESHRLFQGDREITMSDGEFELLVAFIQRPNQVLSRVELLTFLKGYDDHNNPFDRSIDVRVSRVRNKIEPNPARPVYIRTVRGEGYRFCPDGEEA